MICPWQNNGDFQKEPNFAPFCDTDPRDNEHSEKVSHTDRQPNHALSDFSPHNNLRASLETDVQRAGLHSAGSCVDNAPSRTIWLEVDFAIP